MSIGKMGSFEKIFVNSDRHSRRVSQEAERLVRFAHPQPEQRLLDVGCGNGAATLYLARQLKLEVTGVDIDPEQFALAEASRQAIANARFMALDCRKLPFADSEFDIVFTHYVMHHVPGWPKAVAQMMRVLKPGGHLIYSDFILPLWAARLGDVWPGAQGGYATRRALDDLFTRNGLQVVHRLVWPTHFEGVFIKEQS
jgi:ubiquinone/menaquinone biosynthesis C-methylase UbiE